MKPLPETFTSDGFTFRMLTRNAKYAVFKKRKPTWNRDTFEVVCVQTYPEHTWPTGKTSPEREAMPPSSKWGVDGWSYQKEADAVSRFTQLCTDGAGSIHSEP